MDQSDLSVIDSKEYIHPAWQYFVRAMDGRVYGHEPLNQAWAWFKSGWAALDSKLQNQATEWWCDQT